MSGFDVKRRRPWWFGWIPAAVLVLLIAGVGVTALVVQKSGLGAPLPKPTVGQVTELNWSSFSAEGLAYIERSRNVRIDFSRPPVEAAALDLPADGVTTIGPTFSDDTDNDYYLIVNGGGEGYGGTKLTLSELSITTEDGLVTGLTAVASGSLPFRNALALLADDADEFGWGELDTAALFTDWVDTTAAGSTYRVDIGPGERLGFGIVGSLTCEPNGYCVVGYDVAPRVR